MSDTPTNGNGSWTQVALVTGATEGIGYHTALTLAAQGYTVLITGRNQARGDAAASSISAAGGGRAHFIQADHSTVGGDRQAAAAVAERLRSLGLGESLDVLVNNVGGIFPQRTLTPDGYEATLALNFLAPYVVTKSLLPLLAAAPQPRIVVVTSQLSWLRQQVHGDLTDNLDASGNYVGIEAHARAKLLLTAWALGLPRELGSTRITVTAVNPGTAWTRMTQGLTVEVVPSWKYFYPLARWFQKRGDAGKAAQVVVRLATADNPAATNGVFIDMKGKPGKVPDNLSDPAFQQKVANLAERLAEQAPTASSV